MKPAEDSPFFYRCHLKASRKQPDGASERAGQERSGHATRSDESDPDGGGSLHDSPDYPDRNAFAMLDGD